MRRILSNVQDTRYGLTFDLADYDPAPTAVTLTIENLDEAAGTCTLVIDAGVWSLLSSDDEFEIDASVPVGFSGRLKISFPASGATPADDMIIFLLFIVRSDGVVKL